MRNAARVAHEAGDDIEFIEVGRISQPKDLFDRLAKSSDLPRSGRHLAIFLDGLDEASQLPAVAQVIPEGLRALAGRHGSLEKIRLRISCRTAEWPASLGTELLTLWPKDQTGIYQLAPLREADVAIAASSIEGTAAGADDHFLQQVQALGAEPLASRPVTLNLLLNVYRRDRTLPAGRAQLYHQGLLALVEESNKLRRAQPPLGQLDNASRLMVAARIAAASLFSNSTTIWTGLQSEVLPSDAALRLSDIAGGYEPGLGGSFQVGAAELFQVLGTPLFETIGKGEFEFAHKTFLEFLAAYYLVEHKLSADEFIRILAGNPDQKAAGIPPQFREVAAWGASLDRDIFRALIRREPDLLLRSDVATVSDTDREALTAELLQRFDEEQLHDWAGDVRRSYSLLRHPSLAQQLTLYITDKNKSIIARRAAIDIAEAAELTELSNTLLAVALDPLEENAIRVEASICLARIGETNNTRSLRSILSEDLQGDAEDELRGAILMALWPHGLSLEELLRALTPPKDNDFIGVYWRFLNTVEIPPLEPTQALSALEWIDSIFSNYRPEDEPFRFDDLVPRLLQRAWEQADDDRVLERFAQLVIGALGDNRVSWFDISSSKNNRAFLTSYHSGVGTRRLSLVEQVLSKIGDSARAAPMLLHMPWALLTAADLPLILEKLQSDTVFKNQLIELVLGLISGVDINKFDFVWRAAKSIPELEKALDDAYSVVLGSNSALRLREMEARRKSVSASTLFDVSNYQNKIEKTIEGIETTSSIDWWRLNLLLFINERGRTDTHKEFNSDLTASYGWSLLSTELRSRIVSGAYKYLVENRLETTSWVGTNTLYRPAAAGYRAYRLLFKQAPELYKSLEKTIWRRWAPAILASSSNDGAEEQHIRHKIIADLYAKCRYRVLAILKKLLRSEAGQSLALFSEADAIFDDAVGSLIWRALASADSDARWRKYALELLLRRGYEPAVGVALRALSENEPIAGSPINNATTIAEAAAVLLIHHAERAWPLIKATNANNHELARRIWLSAADDWSSMRDTQGSFLSVAGPGDMVELYLWLREQFPPVEEPNERGRFLSAVDHINDLRRALLRHLVAVGTREAVGALDRLVRTLPEESWLKWLVVEARQNERANSWRRMEPREVIALVASYGAVTNVRSTVEMIEAELDLQRTEPVIDETSADDAEVQESVDLPAPPTKPPLRKLQLLLVATEWSSAHGGLSSFNRELCKALAGAGHKVTCLVISATVQEISEAKQAGVELIECPQAPGVPSLQRLLLFRPNLRPGYVPDAVIGHDHITGSQAHHISLTYECAYVHFIHTLPEEIEPFKERHEGGIPQLLRGSEKRRAQAQHCEGAKLVACVGPRIYSEVVTIIGTSCDVPFVQINPGMDEKLLQYQPNLSRLHSAYCLFLGRMEDTALKGADLACSMIKYMASNWSWPQFNKPKLIMRGFSPDNLEREIAAIGGVDGLTEHLIARPFTGDADEIASDFRSSSMVVMPSKREGFGLVALEGIAAGIPVIVSGESGIGWLLHQAAADGQISKETANAYVANVDGDPNGIVADWATRAHWVLNDRQSAFDRARVLRDQLRDLLSWKKAAETLAFEIQELL
jgi:glycosyltransferase involved in cell wall biosynthesis